MRAVSSLRPDASRPRRGRGRIRPWSWPGGKQGPCTAEQLAAPEGGQRAATRQSYALRSWQQPQSEADTGTRAPVTFPPCGLAAAFSAYPGSSWLPAACAWPGCRHPGWSGPLWKERHQSVPQFCRAGRALWPLAKSPAVKGPSESSWPRKASGHEQGWVPGAGQDSETVPGPEGRVHALSPQLSRTPSLLWSGPWGGCKAERGCVGGGRRQVLRGQAAGCRELLIWPGPPPTGHRGDSGLRLDLLSGTCWRSSLRWGDTDSQQGLERR